MKEEALRRPTFRTFIALLDNYESNTGEQEEVTPEEIQENRDFIDAIYETKVTASVTSVIGTYAMCTCGQRLLTLLLNCR